jgi:ATP-dependent 26S proteasome regulatory subunit
MTAEMNRPSYDPMATSLKVKSLLANLRTRPDTGPDSLLQSWRRLPEAVQVMTVKELATHFSRSNGDQLRRLEQKIKQLQHQPLKLFTLESIREDEMGERFALVSTGSEITEVTVSGDVTNDQLIPGVRVVTARGEGAIIGTRDLPPAAPAAEFERVLSDGRLLLNMGTEKIVVQRGGQFCDEKELEKLKPGDLVEYEPLIRYALRLALASVKTAQFVGEVPDVSWDDIGGLNDIRKMINTEVLGPLLNRKAYESYGVGPPRGILFEGPPGVGKTMLIKAIGRSLVSALEIDDDAPVLFQVKSSSLLSSYVGEGPERIRALGAAARDAAKEHGLAIIMLDDFEYGGGLHRGIGDRSSPAYSNLTAALISEMEGLDKGGKVVWTATANRADLIDSALLRPGRFSKKVAVGRPDPANCVQILLVHLRGKPIASGQTAEQMAEKVVEQLFTYDDEHVLLRIHFADGEQEEIFPSRIVSGALLAEAVRCAAISAVTRDLSGQSSEPGGIGIEEMSDALDQQLKAATSLIEEDNVHLHYLGIPSRRAVAAVEHVWAHRQEAI